MSELLRVIEETEADLARMPFFIRPMARRGFEKRTGKSFDEWRRVARELDAGAPQPGLVAALERLAENYRTAPERAGKAMKGAALEAVKQRSSEREQVVRKLIESLRAT